MIYHVKNGLNIHRPFINTNIHRIYEIITVETIMETNKGCTVVLQKYIKRERKVRVSLLKVLILMGSIS